MKKKLFIFMAFLTLYAYGTVAAEEKFSELIYNGDLQVGEQTPENWNIGTYRFTEQTEGLIQEGIQKDNLFRTAYDWQWSEKVGRSGKGFRISNYLGGDFRAALQVDAPVRLPVQGGYNQHYLLTFWYRTSADLTDGAAEVHFINFRVPDMNSYFINETYESLPPSTQWRQAKFILKDITPGTSHVRLGIKLRQTRGSIDMDDFSLLPVSAEIAKKVDEEKKIKAPSIKGQARPDAPFVVLGVNVAKDTKATVLAKGVQAAHDAGLKTVCMDADDDPAKFDGFRLMTVIDVKNLTPKKDILQNKDPQRKEEDSYLVRMRYNKDFPNPYSEGWRKAAAERIAVVTAKFKDNPAFVAYFADDNLDIERLYLYVWTRGIAEKFIDFLKNRYGTIDALNKAWCAPNPKKACPRFKKNKSFEKLLKKHPKSPKVFSHPYTKDVLDFEKIVAADYAKFIVDEVRKYDTKHPVLGPRIAMHNLLYLESMAKSFSAFDALSINFEPGLDGNGISDTESGILKNISEVSGKPVMISEFSVASRNVNQVWVPALVDVPTQQADAVATCIRQLFNMPFVIGVLYRDLVDPVQGNPPLVRNTGLVSSEGEPYGTVVQPLKAAAAEAGGLFR